MILMKGIAEHMRKYLIAYTFLTLILGLLIGIRFHTFFKSNPILVKNLIVTFAILTIYPSMVQLRTEELAKSAKMIKEIAISMFFVFLLAPLLAMAFAKLFGDIDLELGFVTSNVVPASSASIGFVLIAEGNIELATILAVLSLFGVTPSNSLLPQLLRKGFCGKRSDRQDSFRSTLYARNTFRRGTDNEVVFDT